MSQLELWIVSYVLNSLWQVPMLFAAGWMVARMLRPAGPALEHRFWVMILFLQSVLPACSQQVSAWADSYHWWIHTSPSAKSQISISLGPGTVSGGLHLPIPLIVSIVVSYTGVTAWFALRFLWRSRRVDALRREAVPATFCGQQADICAQCLATFSVANVSLAASTQITGPATIGVRRKLILLPAGMVERLAYDDLRTLLAHEFAHLYRQDFLKNLFYELVSLPVAYHPLLWFTQARITESREMACDQIAAGLVGQRDYARSLLRLARMLLDGAPTLTPHTLGIFDAGIFERRIMNLMSNQNPLNRFARFSMITAGTLFLLGTCAFAVDAHVQPVAAATGNHSVKPTEQVSVSAEEMQKNLITKTVPIYPPDAKKAKIQGKVVLNIVIDKGGSVRSVTAVSGPAELQQSAIDAVRQWKYKPYLLHGDPVEVNSTVHVIYALAG